MRDVTIERRRLRTGVTLEVAAVGEREGPVVILLHGFPDLWWTWEGVARELVERGMRVVMPNMRGYGGSEKPVGVGSYDLDLLARDVVALAETEGVERFSVVGHDWGGIVAWWVAAKFPERVTKVVAINAPHPGVMRGYMVRHWGQIVRSLYMLFFQVSGVPEWVLTWRGGAVTKGLMEGSAQRGAFGEGEWGAYRAAWCAPGAMRAMLNYYRAIFWRAEGTLRARVKVPALVVWGKRDLFEQAGLAEASAGMCDAGVEVKWFERNTHWVLREEAAEVGAAVADFLSAR